MKTPVCLHGAPRDRAVKNNNGVIGDAGLDVAPRARMLRGMKRAAKRSAAAEGETLDLHGMRVDEALRAFVLAYNRRVARGDGSPLRVIHGYGSSGGEGAIGRELRRLLTRHGDAASFMAGEEFTTNPGVTIVYPRKPLPAPPPR